MVRRIRQRRLPCPPYYMQNARRDFLADINASAELRRSLEEMSLRWRDPVEPGSSDRSSGAVRAPGKTKPRLHGW